MVTPYISYTSSHHVLMCCPERLHAPCGWEPPASNAPLQVNHAQVHHLCR
jgi:hypothetical protein